MEVSGTHEGRRAAAGAAAACRCLLAAGALDGPSRPTVV